MGDRKLETVAREVFLSIPPDVRTACSSTFSRHATGIMPPAAWSITRGF